MISSNKIPGGGLATAVDVGDPNDIHPHDKQTVGMRLAHLALNQVYHRKDLAYSGPVYRGFKAENGKLRIQFSFTEGGLNAKGGELKGFALAGADQKFHWAKAVIVGNDVELSCPEVPTPVAARYAWADNPDITLYNGAGLPAFPFRTDSWPVY